MRKWLRIQWFAMQTGLKAWAHEPMGHLFSALVLSIALLLPWCLIQGLSNMFPTMDRAMGDPEISVFFKPRASLSTVERAKQHISEIKGISGVEVIEPNTALAILKAQSRSPDLADALPENPLPYTLVVRFRLSLQNDDTQTNQWIQSWKKLDGVEHVQFDSAWIGRLRTLLNGLQLLAIGIGALVSVLVVIVTFNTVRLQLVGQKQDIKVLKSLGATNAEVSRPTLWWSFSLAVFAYLLAYLGVIFAMNSADQNVGSYIREFDSQFQFSPPPQHWTLVGLIAWITLVMGGAWASVRQTIGSIQ